MAHHDSLSGSNECQLNCEKCGMDFSRPRDRLRHIDETHGGRKFCPLECGYGANRAGRLKKHLIKTHKMSMIEARSLVTSNIQRERQSTPLPTAQNTETLVANISSSNNSDASDLSPIQAYTTQSYTPDIAQQSDDQYIQESLENHTYTEMLENDGLNWNGFNWV